MIHLFVIAGISLTATGISWWNGQQTKAVQEQVKVLESQLEAIYAADHKLRHRLVIGYAEELEKLINMESRE